MAEDKEQQEKKVIVDEDWKKEAQKEKEVLAAQEKDEKGQDQAEQQRAPLPRGNFAALISMLVTQTLFSLGAIKVEGQEDKEPDLELARYNIDMLQTIEEKTKGNLTAEEETVLTNTLNEVRMAYVKMAEQKQT